jgi:hypothetical protein
MPPSSGKTNLTGRDSLSSISFAFFCSSFLQFCLLSFLWSHRDSNSQAFHFTLISFSFSYSFFFFFFFFFFFYFNFKKNFFFFFYELKFNYFFKAPLSTSGVYIETAKANP